MLGVFLIKMSKRSFKIAKSHAYHSTAPEISPCNSWLSYDFSKRRFQATFICISVPSITTQKIKCVQPAKEREHFVNSTEHCFSPTNVEIT